jgi:hypothetical protein
MNRLALSTTLGLALVGCAHSVPVAKTLQEEQEKCALVQMVLHEPQPTQELAAFVTEGRELPVPVMVFVRNPDEGMLERFFVGESPECGDGQFQVVRNLGRQGLVVYLQETGSGYSYDARRAGPEELSMGGAPQGVVRRNPEGGWATASD